MSPTSESIKKGFSKEFVLRNQIKTKIIIISYHSISENKMTLNNMLNVLVQLKTFFRAEINTDLNKYHHN
jgi:hypothetical protein